MILDSRSLAGLSRFGRYRRFIVVGLILSCRRSGRSIGARRSRLRSLGLISLVRIIGATAIVRIVRHLSLRTSIWVLRLRSWIRSRRRCRVGIRIRSWIRSRRRVGVGLRSWVGSRRRIVVNRWNVWRWPVRRINRLIATFQTILHDTGLTKVELYEGTARVVGISHNDARTIAVNLVGVHIHARCIRINLLERDFAQAQTLGNQFNRSAPILAVTQKVFVGRVGPPADKFVLLVDQDRLVEGESLIHI